jgi:hypothetical protein
MKLSRGACLAVTAFVALIPFACSDDTGAPSAPTTATASPTPAPTPTPTPTAATRSCSLPAMTDCGRNCCREGGAPEFDNEIAAAQAALRQSMPQLFNPNGSVDEEEEYTALLAKKITEMTGLCARGGGNGTSISKDEVAIKRDNNLSQNVDVIIGSNMVPYVGGRYTCTPASF